MMLPRIRVLLLFLLLIGAVEFRAPSGARADALNAPERVQEACASNDPLRQPFFGDTHVHTTYSFDANSQDTRNSPRDAYRFAQGQGMGIQPYDDEGRPLREIRLDRPLDFTAVTDHAEFLGEMSICTTPGTWSYWHPICFAHRNIPTAGILAFGFRGLVDKERWGLCGEDGADCRAKAGETWAEIIAAAEEANDSAPGCAFTSFVAYEWTASVGRGQNLHRNVIFRGAEVPALPASWIETPSAVDLWDRLEAECVEGIEGCDALTIPHNSNLSGGLIFQSATATSEEEPGPTRIEEARRRSRWEPLVEIMQHKGSSECDSRLPVWQGDEFCGFEKLPYDRFGAKQTSYVESQQATANNYVRWALGEGLRIQGELGVNPFHFGVIGSTDTHIAAPGLTAEQAYPGHGGAGRMEAWGAAEVESFSDDLEFGPGGLAVLWAEENSRDALFRAMQRGEAYGTSGTRPRVRFFGGWDYPEDMCGSPDAVAQAYAGGTPMGGNLGPRPAGATGGPRFLVSALRDPGTARDAGADLERIQIIKGQLSEGEILESVLTVAGGPNDGAVDLATCERRGQGAVSLCSVWEDPDFDPDQAAFYYARVLENPSCRWSQYTCNAAGVRCEDPTTIPEALEGCCSEDHQPIIQERAWTSPIWFSP
jgi:hypothetical protein